MEISSAFNNLDDYRKIGFYKTPDEASREIKKRWGDKKLKEEVEKYLGNSLPDIFKNEPKAISVIHIATPNIAFENFLMQANFTELKPVVFEYLEDLFVTTNYDKACLAKMIFKMGIDKNNNLLSESKHIIALDGREEKKKFTEIKTLWGENFVNFHHRILNSKISGVETCDGSKWYKEHGGKPFLYYKKLMLFFICHGVLFENFLDNEKERAFTREVVFPAFLEAKAQFGIEPLIVPIIPTDEQRNKVWWYYAKDVRDLIDRRSRGIVR
ncbi:MAG: hypothetical protein WCO84_04350 [bacterium]